MTSGRNTIAGQMLDTAADLVDGAREETHGNKLKNFQNIASIWSAYLGNKGAPPVTPEEVATMMELMKIARRQSGSHNPDDYIDSAGYAAVALEVFENDTMERQDEAAADTLAILRNRPLHEGPDRAAISADAKKALEEELTRGSVISGGMNLTVRDTKQGSQTPKAMAEKLAPEKRPPEKI